jgi:hypothetical protein
MQRTLSVIAAVALSMATVATGFTPAYAASPRPAPTVAEADGDIVQVRDRHHRRGRHFSRFDRHRHRHFRPHFAFTIPFFAPYAYYHYQTPRCRGHVFYGRDGRLYCRVY